MTARSLSLSTMTSPNVERLARRYGLVLASGSPRRVKLLNDMGIEFVQIAPEIDETIRKGENPYSYAERLAADKARSISEKHSGAVVIGCDTAVVLGSAVLDKPSGKEDAFRTLTTLAGKKHVVCTAIALVRNGRILASGVETTIVRFNKVSEGEILEYISTGEPMDKAGAYGIQGMGAFLVDSIEGPLDNVIGLPRKLLDGLSAGLPEV